MRQKRLPDLYDVGLMFQFDPRKCVKDKSANQVIREYDVDWTLLADNVWSLLNRDPKERGLADKIAYLLAGYRLVRDMQSQMKGVQEGGLGHSPVSLGRAFRKKNPVFDSSGKKVGAVRFMDILGKPDFTPALTAQLKTRLILEMSEDRHLLRYPKWWIREFLGKAWGLVGESLQSESISRVVRRSRNGRTRN